MKTASLNLKVSLPTKNFSSSLTVWLNGIVTAIALWFAQAPEALASVLSFLGSDQVKQALAVLPPKAKESVDAVVQLIGTLIAAFAAVNVLIRVVKTKAPVAPPKLPFRGGAAMLMLAGAIALAGCGTAKADFSFPAIGAIATPDQADEILYGGTLAYELVVGSINALHANGIFPDAEHSSLITRPGSPAQRLRDGIKKGFELTQRWRESQDRSAFNAHYDAEITPVFAQLKKALQQRGAR